MFKIKIPVVALVAVFALSGIAASSASAAWFVEGEELAAKATLALASTAAVDESATLNVPSVGLKLTCSGSTLDAKHAYIQGAGNLGAESLTFLGCSELIPTTCKIQTEIETDSVVATVEEGAFPADKLRFAPKTGKTLATIEFTGSCAEAGAQPVNGQLAINTPTLQEEQATQATQGQGTTENNSLELFKGKTYLQSGKALLKLTSGERWAFFKGGPIAKPHWYKAGVRTAEGAELKVKTGTGAGVFSLNDTLSNKAMSCKMEDQGKIVNPAGGGPGEGTIEKVTFAKCTSPVCAAGEAPELKALKTPWKLALLARKPPLAEIKGMELEYRCNGAGIKYIEVAAAPMRLRIFNGTGVGEADCTEPTHTTFLEFEALTTLLEREAVNTIAQLSAHDCIWGEAANEVITIASP